MDIRTAILSGASKARKRERFDAPEWAEFLGDRVLYVQELRGKERDAYENSRSVVTYTNRGEVDVKTNHANLRARLAVLSLVDENGNRVFQDSDAEALGEAGADILDRVFEVASRLSRLDRGAPKNSECPAGGTSPTA